MSIESGRFGPSLTEYFRQQEDTKLRYKEVYKASESVVTILAFKDDVYFGKGSGVAVEGGRVFTAFHVVEGAHEVLVCSRIQNRTVLSAEVIGEIVYDDVQDIAAFRLPEDFMPVMPQVRLGRVNPDDELVFLCGFPLIDARLEQSIYDQEITIQPAILMEQGERDFEVLMSTLRIRNLEGISGGAVFDRWGDLIGLVRGGYYVLGKDLCLVRATGIKYAHDTLFG